MTKNWIVGYFLVAWIANCVNLRALPNQIEFNVKVVSLPAEAKSKTGEHVDLGYKFSILPGSGAWIGYLGGSKYLKFEPAKAKELLLLLGRDPNEVPPAPWSLVNYRIALLLAVIFGISQKAAGPQKSDLDREIEGLARSSAASPRYSPAAAPAVVVPPAATVRQRRPAPQPTNRPAFGTRR